jgi:hypothetical protein
MGRRVNRGWACVNGRHKKTSYWTKKLTSHSGMPRWWRKREAERRALEKAREVADRFEQFFGWRSVR